MDSIHALALGVSEGHAHPDRRLEPRALTAAIGQLTREDFSEWDCVIENLSVSGVCVYLQTKLKSGTRAALRVSNIERNVIVRYCNPDERGYKIGLQFTGKCWPERIAGPVYWFPPNR
jgi:hypothetical protein